MPSFSDNIILLTDSYKVSHHRQYPPNTSLVYSYFESRGGAWDHCVFFGLQYFIKRYLTGPVVTKEKIDEAEKMFGAHFSNNSLFHREGWDYILSAHGGYLPVSIKAVPEGSVVPGKQVLMTIENTDPKCYWLTNYLETLLVQVWYPCSVATNSRIQKEIIARFLSETGGSLGGLGFKLHDFGFRGVSSVESAGTGGAAHLVNFLGTDTMPGYVVAAEYYGEPMAGFSIPASEHSTITSWGKDGELEAFKNMLVKYPDGLVACVSDSWDIFHACEKLWGTELKDHILERKGTLVVRPDSGDPPTTVVKVLEILGTKFETTTTSTGHKMLPDQIRVIQGDGVDAASMEKILTAMKQVDGAGRDVWKDPVTDAGKKSKKGRLCLVASGAGGFETKAAGAVDPSQDVLVEVFRDGKLLKDWSFAEVRERAKIAGQ